mmetsp:Transcript_4992/g.7372  ORF Transcript_4992/g.7372 Transcript_4992/m.7372 type:complete len:92 (-) Transcript_4992:549-824(-)
MLPIKNRMPEGREKRKSRNISSSVDREEEDDDDDNDGGDVGNAPKESSGKVVKEVPRPESPSGSINVVLSGDPGDEGDGDDPWYLNPNEEL